VQGLDVRTLVIQDRAAVAAIQVAVHEAPGHVVCMTTHGRGRLRWAYLGSIAEEVVSESNDPVVLLGRHCDTDWPDGLKHMLIGVDGSTKAPSVLPTAIEWARELDLDIHLAMAIHPLDTAPPDPVLGVIADQIEAEGLRVRPTVVRSSYPAGALADLAGSLDVGLVAMNSHARTGLSRVALGSVTMGVVGMARCPVLVVKAA
jgi:nucleotide-binding universal stress UspA family protein